MTRYLIGRTPFVIERFLVTRVLRQFGRQQGIPQGACLYARRQQDRQISQLITERDTKIERRGRAEEALATVQRAATGGPMRDTLRELTRRVQEADYYRQHYEAAVPRDRRNKWTINGRVTHKRPIKAYSTAIKNGHVFSFDIVDYEGCEIRVTCFDEIAQLHSNRVDVGSHYIISKGSIKEANVRYNKLNSYLEIILSDASILKRCSNEEQSDQQRPLFTPISELFHLTNNTLVDIIGLILYVGDIISIHRKDGSQTQKRVVKINDLSGSTIDINLWGPMAEQKGLELKNMLTNYSVVILALRNAHVGYFNGKLINITATTILHINPTFPEAEPLTLRGKEPLLVVPFVAETIHIDGKYTRMTISSIRERMSIKPETIQTTLLVVLRFVNVTDQNLCYTTCPLIVNGRPCKNKCTQQVDDSWFCPRCEMTMQDCNYSYLLPVKLQDATGILWATTFDEGGIHLLHKTAKELCAL
ncbi:replication protein A 70 kDa DNA-binding subunit A-like [Cryptomeria japonica]|uniref:replication protein A 70 kDa DNA-binding subunit A-like n=1 Tax=Cryptomeria japonica TaxID=3369 RepID=UPI0027DA7C02|nr:replication protein A 70 kDa DNA-binding subunit A-like [Cryptomeria japonica]